MALLLAFSACVQDIDTVSGNLSDTDSSNAVSDSTSSETSNESSEDTSSDVSKEESIQSEASSESSETLDTSSDITSETSSDATSEESQATSSAEESTDYSKVPPYLVNGIIIDGTRAMSQFGATSASGVAYATKYINPFKEYLGDKVNLYTTVFPIASAYYAPEKYSSSITSHSAALDVISENLVNVTYIDTLAALRKHVDEDIFFRTDHHWTALGAYYAAQEMAKVMGVPFAELNSDNFVTKRNESMRGSYFGYTKVDGKYLRMLEENPDVFEWYEPVANYDIKYYTGDYCKPSDSLPYKSIFININSYMKFICGDDKCVEITTDCDNGRVLWILKDSYGNALPQYFVSSFSKIYVCDVRYFKLGANDFINEHGITDVCVAMSSTSAAGGNARCLKSLMK